MWKTQKLFEVSVSVINESTPVRGTGGIAVISDDTETEISMVIMPDYGIHREPRKEGQYVYERIYAHVRADEMAKADMIVGKTRIEWNGNIYMVHSIIDYTSLKLFQIAEIEMRRKLDSY